MIFIYFMCVYIYIFFLRPIKFRSSVVGSAHFHSGKNKLHVWFSVAVEYHHRTYPPKVNEVNENME